MHVAHIPSRHDRWPLYADTECTQRKGRVWGVYRAFINAGRLILIMLPITLSPVTVVVVLLRNFYRNSMWPIRWLAPLAINYLRTSLSCDLFPLSCSGRIGIAKYSSTMIPFLRDRDRERENLSWRAFLYTLNVSLKLERASPEGTLLHILDLLLPVGWIACGI